MAPLFFVSPFRAFGCDVLRIHEKGVDNGSSTVPPPQDDRRDRDRPDRRDRQPDHRS
jgi:hypothetical protein